VGGGVFGGFDATVVGALTLGVGAGDELGGGVVGFGAGFGVGRGDGLGVGFGFGVADGCGREVEPVLFEISKTDGRRAARVTVRTARRGRTAGRRGCVTGVAGMRTTGGVGAGSTTLGFAALRTSFGELDSKAARQRYPEVTPAATSAHSRSASNEIRIRISIGPLPDSIGANIRLR